jgi:hypothetical protein
MVLQRAHTRLRTLTVIRPDLGNIGRVAVAPRARSSPSVAATRPLQQAPSRAVCQYNH